MLRITISRDAAGAVAYYAQALSKEDYFFQEKTVEAHWRGKAAEMLGITGLVDKETFACLVKNAHPQTKERITVRNASNRRAGYEYLFCANKSASVLYAITKDEDIIEAHRLGVQTAMQEIERDMQTQAGQAGRKYYETTGNIIYAAFEHMTTRPTEKELDGKKNYVPDPLLHTHCFVPSVTWNERTQRWQAIEESTIRKQANYYESIYHSVFSEAMRKVGYNIERTINNWEVKGIDRNIRDKYSSRTKEIEVLAKQKNITDAKEKAELGALTRIKKNKGVEDHKLQQIWQDRLGTEELARVLSAKGNEGRSDTVITPKQAVDMALEHWLERNSAAMEKRVLGTAMAFSYGALNPEAIKQELAGRDNILKAEKQSISYITTKEMLQKEESMLRYAVNGKGTLPPIHSEYQIKRSFLNDEQRKAIEHILGSQDKVSLLVGAAGVGKTSLLTEVREAITEVGKELIAVAPSAQASRGVLRQKGFKDSDTIAALLKDQELQDRLKDNVLLVDEAGMVGVDTLLGLFDLVEKQNARIILSGDPKQHNSVEFGDGMRILQDKAGLEVATVKRIVRQKQEPYRQAIEDLAKGHTYEGFKRLDKMGAVKEIEDPELRQKTIAKDYVDSVALGRSALIVSPTHVEGQVITEQVREHLKDRGILKGEERLFDTQRSLSLTEAQKQDKASYQQGQIVQFHQNQKGGFKAGGRYEVLDKQDGKSVRIRDLRTQQEQTLPVDKPENFQVYQPMRIPLAQEDLIRITNNGRTKENTKIHNGQTYTVKGFTEQGDILLSNGKTLNKDHANFQHGYVSTSHASQGKDAKDVFIAQSAMSYPASNEKQWYVSASRGTENIKIYTDNKIDLKQAILRSGDRMSAQEVADQHYRRRVQQQRTNYYSDMKDRTIEHGRQARPYEHQPTVQRDRRAMDRE